MLKQRFVFAVSLIAVLAVGNAWADTASGDAVKTAHDVYTDLSTTETGIAGVSYVNKMVNVAGAAAQDAENHAASAGASALSAAAAASAAQTAADNAQTTADSVANKQDKSTAVTHVESTAAGTASKPVYVASTGAATVVTSIDASLLPVATSSTKGAVIVDASLSSSSTNPVQNKAVNTALSAKEATANKLTSTATTTISDTNKDTLYPTVGKVQAMVNALDVTDTAVSGKYVSAVSETDGKIAVTRASLPTIGNATLTIQRNGTTVDTFTANATSNKTINITDNDTTYTAGTNITISDGVISATDTVYTLPDATTSVKGGVIVGDNISVSSGKISVPAATTTTKGVVVVDSTLSSTSTNPVQNKAVNTALSGKQATISDLETIRSGAAAGATAVQPSAISDMQTKSNMKNEITDDMDKESTYPTVALLETQIDSSAQETGQEIAAINTSLSGKQATLTGTNVTSTGSGNVVTAVTAANGVVTVTKGTTLGSLATKSTVATADIDSSAVTTAKIADGAVTVAKTTGLYGIIPSGGQGSTTATAYIWVE